MANENLTTYTNMHSDSPIQSKEYIEKTLRESVQAHQFWDKFCQHKPWVKGTTSLTYRRLTRPVVTTATPLAEGIAPRPTKIGYTEYRATVANYREKSEYTRDAEIFNYDDAVRDATSTLSYLFTKKLDIVKGTPFKSSKCIITAETTMVKTAKKARIILQKNEVPTYEGGEYLWIMTPECMSVLEDELEAKGVSLNEATKSELLGVNVNHKYGFTIVVDATGTLLHGTGDKAGKHTMIFMGKTLEGTSPVTCYQYGGVEAFHDAPGSAIIEDVDGNLTADNNRQKGAVSMNAWGLGAAVNDDFAILNCDWTVTTIDPALITDAQRTGYVR